MKRMAPGLVALLVGGCGGLADSNTGDAGADRGPISHVDAGSIDGGTVDAHDAATDAHVHDATTDAPVCPGTKPSSAWSVFPLPSLEGGAPYTLKGVWGSGPNDVWAVGGAGAGTHDVSAIILHWDGSAWSTSPAPVDGHWAGYYTLSGVWGSGPNDVWAVGGVCETGGCIAGTILHWDGSLWSATVPLSDGGAALVTSLTGVWGSGPNDVWAVGDVGILHWDGSAWSAPPFASPLLVGVWGSGPNDVWVVGWGASPVAHWDGSAWSRSALPASDGGRLWTTMLSSVWGSGTTDVWTLGGTYDGSLVLHWDGSAWSTSTSPWTNSDVLSGVWGSGPKDVWAVGSGIWHWDGSAWSVSTNTMGGSAVWGSGPCDVWAVGARILHHP
jgi:hypothetical protein